MTLTAEIIDEMTTLYGDGKSVRDIADTIGVSVGKAYYILRDTGCVFRKPGIAKGTKLPDEWIEHSANSRRGGTKSESAKQKLSEAKKCHYNGFNGVGHLKRRSNGYIAAYVPDHPRATADGYVMLHTIVMERHIGRYIHPNEVVHHINHQRNDNRIENLTLMTVHDHQSMHLKERLAKERESKRRNDLSTELS